MIEGGEATPIKKSRGALKEPWKPGASGNPLGRPKGARNRLAEAFLRDMYEAWEKNGARACEIAIAEDPMGFINAVSRVIPKEFEIGGSGVPIEGVMRIEFVKVDQIEGKAG